ncbi:MAG: hypothetical protein A2896_03050 [Candidatus Nealsonbacteria bacterium RIFCSPLOWO2_01_FULL_43_32]|uniref:Uncharacterized protein n=1 Tax=Candidatus Nealsonbacteria bacterium RIFCSPLOWO2_01_FULL_43_32 TaxID=1801672 RepID=A0A1G2EDJ4_9BACT|nr:MAG: hypothetical protein A2896_03050 [Candidatus Nealsonbacteria bacterium RIFCSPLOWO2_01_FULL_43_32]
MQKQVSPKIVALTFGILTIAFLAAFYVVAWQEPTQAPPGGNVAAPLNISNVGQSKEGGLILNTGGAEYGLIVDEGKTKLEGNGLILPPIYRPDAPEIGQIYLDQKDNYLYYYNGNQWIRIGTSLSGAGCTSPEDCESGFCYRDEDGDGYSMATGQKFCQTVASAGTDCYDANVNARPGQTSYFTVNRGDGSFDYDCDGIQGASCATVSNLSPTTCKWTYGNETDEAIGGWLGSSPACGTVGVLRYVNSFGMVGGYCVGKQGYLLGCGQKSGHGYYGTLDLSETQTCK